ncbi:Mrpl42 [Columba guinea]|nr:Mrpl42 [Columba guinea]
MQGQNWFSLGLGLFSCSAFLKMLRYVFISFYFYSKVELAVTSDLKTIVCYHPSLEIPYEHTKPIPRPDPVNNTEETLDQVLKSRLNEKELKNSRGPTIEELSKMFYTTKHRWYPVGHNIRAIGKAIRIVKLTLHKGLRTAASVPIQL